MVFGPESEEPVRVLFVAGEEPGRRMLKTLLGNCPDIEVVADARDGSEAVCLAGSYRPDIVLLDLPISGMCGTQAIRMVKRLWPKIAVLALSSTGELEADASGSGADALLTGAEPFRIVIDTVRDLTGRSPVRTLRGLKRCKS